MSPDELRAIINKLGGANKVWGFQFDGNGEKIFRPDKPFTMDMIQDDIKCLVFDELSSDDEPYKIYKPIATVYSVIAIDDIKNAFNYEPREIFG